MILKSFISSPLKMKEMMKKWISISFFLIFFFIDDFWSHEFMCSKTFCHWLIWCHHQFRDYKSPIFIVPLDAAKIFVGFKSRWVTFRKCNSVDSENMLTICEYFAFDCIVEIHWIKFKKKWWRGFYHYGK